MDFSIKKYILLSNFPTVNLAKILFNCVLCEHLIYNELLLQNNCNMPSHSWLIFPQKALLGSS